MQVEKAAEHILERLRNELPSYLLYHSVDHTMDVKKQALRIAREEGIESDEELLMLETAALYHDCGFLETYADHEERGCEIARDVLPQFGYNDRQITIIEGMIMATKVPQQPKTKLEQIICDADLDYLGRDDFFSIGDNLYEEFLHKGIVKDELSWNQLQVKFLNAHHYFTPTNIAKRGPGKEQHLQLVIKKIDNQ